MLESMVFSNDFDRYGVIVLALSFYEVEENIGFSLSAKGKNMSQTVRRVLPIPKSGFSISWITLNPCDVILYYLAYIKDPIDKKLLDKLATTLDLEDTEFDASRCHRESREYCEDNEYLTVTERGMRHYTCVCNEGYGYEGDVDNRLGSCAQIVENCRGFCTEGCKEITSDDATEVECYRACAENYESLDSKGDFTVCIAKEEIPEPEQNDIICVEEKSSRSGWFWFAAIGIPVIAVAAVAITGILARSGGCGCLTKFCGILHCCKGNDDQEMTPANVDETTPNKVTNNLTAMTNNAANNGDNVLGNEGGMNECKSNLMASRNYLDPSSLKVEVLDIKPEQISPLKKLPTGLLEICGACKKPNANLLSFFSCGHQSLCGECSGKVTVCPSCGEAKSQ
eukprot:TRINITY_DN4555_c0_g4_i1.p1 TRINITY_DN4555_c0_g4~~TRINITY_DN4555_c0_g4_i1.p1  ORF type:complete len:397 (+),score=48.97 TRINITY_DN4555_c0_g4_i1:423-1613(+)